MMLGILLAAGAVADLSSVGTRFLYWGDCGNKSLLLSAEGVGLKECVGLCLTRTVYCGSVGLSAGGQCWLAADCGPTDATGALALYQLTHGAPPPPPPPPPSSPNIPSSAAPVGGGLRQSSTPSFVVVLRRGVDTNRVLEGVARVCGVSPGLAKAEGAVSSEGTLRLHVAGLSQSEARDCAGRLEGGVPSTLAALLAVPVFARLPPDSRFSEAAGIRSAAPVEGWEEVPEWGNWALLAGVLGALLVG
eukprot:Hpha_TRINITY_DN35780_c0_g1::TRINITY_DN35780_c0_g1_i1::g.139952::m.139952